MENYCQFSKFNLSLYCFYKVITAFEGFNFTVIFSKLDYCKQIISRIIRTAKYPN